MDTPSSTSSSDSVSLVNEDEETERDTVDEKMEWETLNELLEEQQVAWGDATEDI